MVKKALKGNLSLHADTKARNGVYHKNWQGASPTSAAHHQVLSSEDRLQYLSVRMHKSGMSACWSMCYSIPGH